MYLYVGDFTEHTTNWQAALQTKSGEVVID